MKAAKQPDFFSLIVPAVPDREKFDAGIDNLCAVLDERIPGCYEIVAVEGQTGADSLSEWDNVRGEILVIVDGDLGYRPTTLGDIVAAFLDGSDMAFASQYNIDRERHKNEPDLSYLGIRRSSLPRLHESPEGYKLILEILGPDTIRKLSTRPADISGNYILRHLRRVIGVQ